MANCFRFSLSPIRCAFYSEVAHLSPSTAFATSWSNINSLKRTGINSRNVDTPLISRQRAKATSLTPFNLFGRSLFVFFKIREATRSNLRRFLHFTWATVNRFRRTELFSLVEFYTNEFALENFDRSVKRAIIFVKFLLFLLIFRLSIWNDG